MNKQQLAAKIWTSANNMRSKIEASEYKDFILGFIFYKYVSEAEERFAILNGMSKEEFKDMLVEDDAATVKFFFDNLGYFIPYDYLFSKWINDGNAFSIADVRQGLSCFTRNINPDYKKVYDKVFDTLQTGLGKLGQTDAEQSKSAKDIIFLINEIPMDGKQGFDVLGYIYEYLISQFAANAGKKAGEFYTPHEVSELMSEIVSYHLRNNTTVDILDPTSGSGSLLINIGKCMSKHIDPTKIVYFAQELKESTYNLTRMNLVMRGINPANINCRRGDTLANDWPMFEEDSNGQPNLDTYHALSVDAVVSNPPYSQKWDAPKKINASYQNLDVRYERFGVAPQGKADYAFLLHDLYHIKDNGIVTIVLPHGVLFRGSVGDFSEGDIRKNLIEYNHIDTIIGLPSNIFFGTGIPTIIMVLKKPVSRGNDHSVLFIDASQHFAKEGKNNKLRECDIRRIVDAYKNRKDIPHFAHVASLEEIRANEYNLNIPRYVNVNEVETEADLYATMNGGVPNSELDSLHEFWDVMPKLRDSLFADNSENANYCTPKTDDLRSAISQHADVKNYEQSFVTAFNGLEDYLINKLINNVMTLNVAQTLEEISEDLFSRIDKVKLADNYAAYQLFADKWKTISQDIETIQTEGFGCTRKVDPNMVVKTKDGKEYEVQDGWTGHILPFELVQKLYLADEYDAIQAEKDNLNAKEALIQEIIENLTDEERSQSWLNEEGDKIVNSELKKKSAEIYADVETETIATLKDCLSLYPEKRTPNKEQKTAISNFMAKHNEILWKEISTGEIPNKKDLNAYITKLQSTYNFPEDTSEYKIVRLYLLSIELDYIKDCLKTLETNIHLHTKEKIENGLSDDQVKEVLRHKWILDLIEYLQSMPETIVQNFTQEIIAIVSRYNKSLNEIEKEEAETAQELCSLFADLTMESEEDAKAIEAIRQLLTSK